MGKATIVGGGAGGLYQVKLEYDGLDRAIAQIGIKRVELEARIAQLETTLSAAENERVQAKQVADALIADWVAGLPVADGEGLVPEWSESAMQYVADAGKTLAVPDSLLNAIGAASTANWAVIDADQQLNTAYAEYLSVTTREAELDRLQSSNNATISAWCADYTEDLTGTVATMEVPGEVEPVIGGGINIKPGYFDQAAYNAAYGQIQNSTILSEAGFAWNFTMIQPWMKWMPKWRYATVTGKDEENDTVDVELHPILSKARVWLRKQNDFNDPWNGSMSGVPVEYMSCGAKVFEIGDDVIVEFRAGGGGGLGYYEPFVIGFKEEPNPCAICSVGVISNTDYSYNFYPNTDFPDEGMNETKSIGFVQLIADNNDIKFVIAHPSPNFFRFNEFTNYIYHSYAPLYYEIPGGGVDSVLSPVFRTARQRSLPIHYFDETTETIKLYSRDYFYVINYTNEDRYIHIPDDLLPDLTISYVKKTLGGGVDEPMNYVLCEANSTTYLYDLVELIYSYNSLSAIENWLIINAPDITYRNLGILKPKKMKFFNSYRHIIYDN